MWKIIFGRVWLCEFSTVSISPVTWSDIYWNNIFTQNIIELGPHYRERNKNRVPISFWIAPWQFRFCYCSYLFYIVCYYIKWVTTSWIYSTIWLKFYLLVHTIVQSKGLKRYCRYIFYFDFSEVLQSNYFL